MSQLVIGKKPDIYMAIIDISCDHSIAALLGFKPKRLGEEKLGMQ
jgi:hypothetical protein